MNAIVLISEILIFVVTGGIQIANQINTGLVGEIGLLVVHHVDWVSKLKAEIVQEIYAKDFKIVYEIVIHLVQVCFPNNKTSINIFWVRNVG